MTRSSQRALLIDFSGVIANFRQAFSGEPGPSYVAVPVDVVVDAVLRTRAAGIKTCLVSNFDRVSLLEVATAIDFDAMFDELVFSSDGDFAKPDIRIYLFAAERLGVDPAECLFVDDLPRNVDAAGQCGMKGAVAADAATAVAAIDTFISAAY